MRRILILLQPIGRILFWLSWPILGVYLSHSKRTRILVGCGDMVLVTKSWLGSGKWSLPGGGLHRNELPLEGALRELYEETGLQLSATDLQRQPLLTFNFYGQTCVYYFFIAEVIGLSNLRPQPFEIVSTEWLAVSRLTAQTAGPDILAALKTRETLSS